MFEAAIVGAPPERFETLEQALEYIADTPVCENKVRPWIRNVTRSHGQLEFLIIAGRAKKHRESCP